MTEVKEGQVKQPWECMAEAFKQVSDLFKDKEKKPEEKHD